jgi:hypothetical protein
MSNGEQVPSRSPDLFCRVLLPGSGTWFCWSSSFPHSATCAWSSWTSGGRSAGASTNAHSGLPVSLRVMYRNGFSKL